MAEPKIYIDEIKDDQPIEQILPVTEYHEILRERLNVGSGNNVFISDYQGIYLGNSVFTNAPFRVSMAGNLTATSGSFGSWTISGNTFTTTADNILVGIEAGGSITTGIFNNCLGHQTGKSLTSGSENVFLGYEAGYSMTIGGKNVFLGIDAGYSVVNQNLNVMIGAYTGYSTTGAANTLLGAYAGNSLTSGNYNIFLGYKAGYYETGSDKLFIDNQQRTSESNARLTTLIYGIMNTDATLQSIRFNATVISGWDGNLANAATKGFLYIPMMDGAPTALPTAYSGKAPIVYDATNDKLYIHDGASWKSVALT